jgi:hypothetical protein
MTKPSGGASKPARDERDAKAEAAGKGGEPSPGDGGATSGGAVDMEAARERAS